MSALQLAIAWTAFALLLLERIVELRLSQRNATRVLARGGVEYGADHYPWMVIAHTLFLAATVYDWVRSERQWPFWATLVALSVVLATMALRYWAIATLGDRWNTRVLVEPGVAAVSRGPYRFLRHPNYVAVVFEIAALPLLLGAWPVSLFFSVVNAWILRVRIRCENAALHAHCDPAGRYGSDPVPS